MVREDLARSTPEAVVGYRSTRGALLLVSSEYSWGRRPRNFRISYCGGCGGRVGGGSGGGRGDNDGDSWGEGEAPLIKKRCAPPGVLALDILTLASLWNKSLMLDLSFAFVFLDLLSGP